MATLRRASSAVLSVDLLAASRETYETLTGVDGYEPATTNLRHALEKRAGGRKWGRSVHRLILTLSISVIYLS